MSQTNIIKLSIERFLDAGITDKSDIYTKVVEETGLPRPTVRRVAQEMLKEFKRRCAILQPTACEEGNIESR